MTEKQALKGLGRHVKWYNNHCSEWTMLASLERTGSIVVSTQSWRGAVRGRASSTCGTRRSTTRPPLNWSPIPRVELLPLWLRFGGWDSAAGQGGHHRLYCCCWGKVMRNLVEPSPLSSSISTIRMDDPHAPNISYYLSKCVWHTLGYLKCFSSI